MTQRDDKGNVRVDFAWGNVPMQPNDDRIDDDSNTGGYYPPELGAGDSHNINATSWNSYPELSGSKNYMITGAEYLGEGVYEYTSENELEAGDEVRTTGCPGYNGVATVVYADKLKFRTENELPGSEKLTGLYGRVEVLGAFASGRTLNVEGTESFVWPSVGFCYSDPKSPGNTWQDMIEYLRDCGVDPALLKEATFTGGENKYDWQNGDYDDENAGIIFWSYLPKNAIIWVDWETGTVLTGKDFNGKVIGASLSAGTIVATNPEYIDDLWFTAITNDPTKNDTAGWL